MPGGIFLLTLLSLFVTAANPAHADTRTLKLYNVHTKERAEVTFKRNGSYVSDGLRKANKLLRDWRRNEPTKMDPRLLDLVWETYRAVGGRDYIHIVSGYRSPATNSMLRRTRGGQAKKSQHMLGKAMDFYIPGVSLAKLRATGLKAQIGGVGYYPRSGSPFVHLDVGNVRHWPRMSRKQLMAVFPDGKSIHVPSDGKPLPRYKEALASYNSRKKSGGSIFALSNSSGDSDAGGKKPTLLAALFGGGADEEEETSAEFETKPSAAAAKKTLESEESEAVPATADAPKEEPKPEEEVQVAALPARNAPVPAFAPRQKETLFPEPAAASQLPQMGVPSGMPDVPQAGIPTAPVPPGMVPGADGQLPQDVPVAETAQPVEVANVPFPTRRPKYQVADPALPDSDLAVLAALQSRETEAAGAVSGDADAQAKALLAAMAANDASAASAQQPAGEPLIVAGLPVPSPRPGEDAEAVQVAAVEPLTASDFAPAVAAEAPAEAQDEAIAAAPAAEQPIAVLAKLEPASPRKAILENGGDTAAASANVKTTPKAKRPSVADVATAEAPKARAVPVEADVQRWALLGQPESAAKSSRVKGKANKVIRTAPTEVIAQGFDQAPPPDPSRFSGNAVTFLSVAKFQKTN